MIYYQYPHNQWSASQLSQLHTFYLSNAGDLEPLQKAKIKNQGQFGADKSTKAIATSLFTEDKGLSADQVLLRWLLSIEWR